MNIQVYGKSGFHSVDSLWEALSLEWFKEEVPLVLAVTGAGGKTSLICRLAQEAQKRGIRVLVTTTTHMYRPKQYARTVEEVRRFLRADGVAWLGADASEEKITYPGDEIYQASCGLAGLVLVEADGSKRLPVKVPASHEPVIPDNTSMILSVFGMTAIGKPIEEVCFRRTEAEKIYKAWGGDSDFMKMLVTPELFCLLMRDGYLGPLKERFRCPVIPVFHQADTEERMLLGECMMRKLFEKSQDVGSWLSSSSFPILGLLTALKEEDGRDEGWHHLYGFRFWKPLRV